MVSGVCKQRVAVEIVCIFVLQSQSTQLFILVNRWLITTLKNCKIHAHSTHNNC